MIANHPARRNWESKDWESKDWESKDWESRDWESRDPNPRLRLGPQRGQFRNTLMAVVRKDSRPPIERSRLSICLIGGRQSLAAAVYAGS